MSDASSEDEEEPPTPIPVHERPPHDRFCDLILNGGVASGVVYPWALVELARHYRFRNIGGNSVGAIAAALAAAAEYGRCTGNARAFEALRRVPLDLAEEEQGRTRMLRLFQPAAGVRRLFESFLAGVRHGNLPRAHAWLSAVLTLRDLLGIYWLWWLLVLGECAWVLSAARDLSSPSWLAWSVAFAAVAAAERFATSRNGSPGLRGGLLAALAVLLAAGVFGACLASGGVMPAAAALGWPVVVALVWSASVWRELGALRDNGWGLCSGKSQPASAGGALREEALIEWLHRGVQLSAGRGREDPPLTFADLWGAPRACEPGEESISLHMFSTNVTLGRPVAWPLRDQNARLFFRKAEWKRFFPPALLDALWDASAPYAPASDSDPPVSPATEDLRELPAGGMPIAVAARLSLSFPLLFSCIPVHAIDYEDPRDRRVLRRCQLTDGGLCTNFPIHLFDASHPRWPTFGLMLSRRNTNHKDEEIWLPDHHLEGRADNWSRDVPGAGPPASRLAELKGLLFGMGSVALNWNDNLVGRLAHVRNRVLRMHLQDGEGQLNITMSRSTILHMAHIYGTAGGQELVRRFKSDGAMPTQAWREHLYVRAVNQVRALGQHLRGYSRAVAAGGFSEPMASVLRAATQQRPLRQTEGRAHDPAGEKLEPHQAGALLQAVEAIAALERSLEATAAQWGPYHPQPPTRLQVRSRM